MRFDSKREAARWIELRALQDAGRIADLRRQVRFSFPLVTDTGRRISYVADFVYRAGGVEVVEDAKGYETDVSRLKRAMMRYFHAIEVRISPDCRRSKAASRRRTPRSQMRSWKPDDLAPGNGGTDGCTT